MSFSAMPPVPMVGLDSFIAAFMLATKQNMELLTGQYGDIRFRSIVRGQVTVLPTPAASLTQLTAKGDGVTISGADVPTLAEALRQLAARLPPLQIERVRLVGRDDGNVDATLTLRVIGPERTWISL